MPLDYHSLLTAFALSGCGLAITFFVSWLASRTERFLIAWTFGVAFMALGVLIYSWYAQTMVPAIGAAGYTILLTGLAFVFGAGGGATSCVFAGSSPTHGYLQAGSFG